MADLRRFRNIRLENIGRRATHLDRQWACLKADIMVNPGSDDYAAELQLHVLLPRRSDATFEELETVAVKQAAEMLGAMHEYLKTANLQEEREKDFLAEQAAREEIDSLAQFPLPQNRH